MKAGDGDCVRVSTDVARVSGADSPLKRQLLYVNAAVPGEGRVTYRVHVRS